MTIVILSIIDDIGIMGTKVANGTAIIVTTATKDEGIEVATRIVVPVAAGGIDHQDDGITAAPGPLHQRQNQHIDRLPANPPHQIQNHQ